MSYKSTIFYEQTPDGCEVHLYSTFDPEVVKEHGLGNEVILQITGRGMDLHLRIDPASPLSSGLEFQTEDTGEPPNGVHAVCGSNRSRMKFMGIPVLIDSRLSPDVIALRVGSREVFRLSNIGPPKNA
jgi:hypothetical protein